MSDLRSKLQQYATTLLTSVTHYTLGGLRNTTIQENAQSDILHYARLIIATLERATDEPALDDCAKIGEMLAKQAFNSWGVFQRIPAHGSVSYAELAGSVGCDVQLLTRFAWMLHSTGVLCQIGKDKVAHTEKSRIFIDGNPKGDLTQIMFTHGLVSYARMLDYFKQYGRQEPEGPAKVPFSFAYGQPEKTIWEVCYQNAKAQQTFMRAMTAMGAISPVCGIYDFSSVIEAAKVDDGSRKLLVDIGGGNGHAIRSLSASGLPLQRCVLQDTESVINEVVRMGSMPGLSLMAIDMHKEQPVKGAMIYYVRYCLHDYSDNVAIHLLSVIADAMAPDSKLLIAEQILDNPPSVHAAALDLLMLSVGGKERTEEMWADVVSAAGLDLVKIWTGANGPYAVIECVKRVL